MGILGENTYENLGMMSHSIEMFWHVLRNTNGFGDENFEAWALALYKNWWLDSDAIPFQIYRTTTIPELGKA